MVLIGSKALEEKIKDIGRITHDYDVLMSKIEWAEFHANYHQYLIKNVKDVYLYEIPNIGIVEVLHEFGFTKSDKDLYNFCSFETDLPFGRVSVPEIGTLFDIKKATAEFIDEPKHKYDLDLMVKNYPFLGIREDTEFYKLRREEIKTRIEKQDKVKYDFFHKYHIPEYIKHDYLHELIADLIDIKLPTYQRITSAEVDIAESLFNKLTHEQKISLMVEESLVLALERWYIPQMIENGINAKLIDIFYNDNEGLPTYKILKHCCITGLKGEAEYITTFARENFFEIEREWRKAKEIINTKKNGFPQSFYDKLFELRDKYKKGEKVGTI